MGEAFRKRYYKNIKKNSDKKLEFILIESVEDIKTHLPEAEVLFVAGGKARLIEPIFKELGFLKDMIKGKTYIGSSMGAFMVSEKYVLSFDSQDQLSVHEGLGLLPFNSVCHWNVEERKELKLGLLQEVSEKPILTLDECQYVKLEYRV